MRTRINSALLVGMLLASVLAPASVSACLSRIGTQNDSLGFGWGPAADDFRSFGFIGELECGRLTLDIGWWGFTNRSDRQPRLASRVDEAAVDVHWRFLQTARTALSGSVGSRSRGNLGGEEVQNAMHRTTGHPEVHLPYDDRRHAPAIGTTFTIEALRLDPAMLRFRIRSWVAPAYGGQVEGGAALHLGPPEFQFTPSVTWRNGYRLESPALERAMQAESGVVVGFAQRLSFLSFAWEAIPGTEYSSGTIAVVLANNDTTHREFRREAVSADFGLMISPAEAYFTKHRIPIWDRFSASLTGTWGPLVQNRIAAFPSVRAHIQQLDMGPEVSLFHPAPHLQVNPFGRLAVGMRREAIYAAERDHETLRRVSPAFAAEAGVRLTTPLRLLDEGILYGLVVFYRYSLTQSKDVSVFDAPHVMTAPQHQAGAGFTFSADL